MIISTSFVELVFGAARSVSSRPDLRHGRVERREGIAACATRGVRPYRRVFRGGRQLFRDSRSCSPGRHSADHAPSLRIEHVAEPMAKKLEQVGPDRPMSFVEQHRTSLTLRCSVSRADADLQRLGDLCVCSLVAAHGQVETNEYILRSEHGVGLAKFSIHESRILRKQRLNS